MFAFERFAQTFKHLSVDDHDRAPRFGVFGAAL